MTGWTRICRADELAVDVPVGRVVAGEGAAPSARVCVAAGPDGDPVAMLDRCPHRDIALSDGRVRDGVLTCPGHFWRFDLATGCRVDLPRDRVTRYPTRVVDGWVEAQLPAPEPPPSMRQWLLDQAAKSR